MFFSGPETMNRSRKDESSVRLYALKVHSAVENIWILLRSCDADVSLFLQERSEGERDLVMCTH